MRPTFQPHYATANDQTTSAARAMRFHSDICKYKSASTRRRTEYQIAEISSDAPAYLFASTKTEAVCLITDYTMNRRWFNTAIA
jgi:hypothetical protein